MMWRRLLQERGGVAILMALAFMALGVPVITSALGYADALTSDSRVKTDIVRRHYCHLGFVEYVRYLALDSARWATWMDPDGAFAGTGTVAIEGCDDANLSMQLLSDTPGDTPGLTFEQLQISFKVVTPSEAMPGSPTDFDYTITLKNQGTGTITLQRVTDFLPPHISYIGPTWGSITSDAPTTITPNAGLTLCGDSPDQLTWDVEPGLELAPGESASLSFTANGALPEGIYYNKATLRYEPSWALGTSVDIHTPYTAEITVGEGAVKCGFNLEMLLRKKVTDVRVLAPGEMEVTYTISMENVTTTAIPVQRFEDLMPPGFIYLPGSSEGITTDDPVSDPDPCEQPPDIPDMQRCLLTWGGGDLDPPLVVVAPGEEIVQTIKAITKDDPTLAFYNEIRLVYQPPGFNPWATATADVAMVLDNSGSIDVAELVLLQEASNAIVEGFSLSTTEQRIRMGITRFRGGSESIADMTDIDIHDIDSFYYVDDAFRGTTQPAYADGQHAPLDGFTDGALKVEVGGVNNAEILGMSGGWRQDFTLANSTEVMLSFRYNMTMDSGYESDEYSQVIVTVDAMQPGTGLNDYVAQLVGDGGGGPDVSTGWQIFQVNLGTLAPGAHNLTIGGYNNKKTSTGEITEILIDDVLLQTGACIVDPVPALEVHYDADAEGGIYFDDTFRGTSEPDYAQGDWQASAGFSGGGVHISLGWPDNDNIYGMSGGWRHPFTLASDTDVTLSFMYNLTQAAQYESDEYSQVIVTLDALQPGSGGNDYVAQIVGDGNSGPPQTTGWQLFQTTITDLAAGPHTLTVGGYNNKKTFNNEVTDIEFDDVMVVGISCTYDPVPVVNEDFANNTPLHDAIDAMEQGGSGLPSGTNIVSAINGGRAEFDTGLGDRAEVPNMMIVITDGDDNAGNSNSAIANASSNSGAEIFAVGVGTAEEVDPETLFAISFDPDIPGAVFDNANPDPYYSDHVFHADDFSGLIDIVDDIVNAVLGASQTVVTAEGGTATGGMLYEVTAVLPDGTVITYQALVTSDGEVQILDWPGS